MKRKNYVPLAIGLISLLLMTGCGTKNEESKQNIPEEHHLNNPAVVIVKDPEAEDLKTIDARDFISVSFPGLDTLGTADMTVDYDALTEYIYDGEYTEWDRELIDCYIAFRPEKLEGLCNGDSFVVNVVPDDLDMLDCRVKETKLIYTVSGLEEMERVDVFENLVLTYEGTCPYVKAKASNPSTDLFIQSINYEVSPLWFNEGDTVTVRAVYSEETAKRYGCVAENTEYQFVAKGLSYYIKYPEQINEDCMAFMCEQAKTIIPEALRVRAYELSKIVAPDEYVARPLATCERAARTGVLRFFHAKEGTATYTVMPCEISYTLYEKNWDTLDEICSGTIYMGVVFDHLRIDSDGTVSAANCGKVSYVDLQTTEFALTEEELYEKLMAEYREENICYEPIYFEVGE